MIIYICKNKIDGKSYIGQSQFSLTIRWRRHRVKAKMGSPYYFHNAIRKYGPEAFDCQVLWEGTVSKNTLDAMESTFIFMLDTKAPLGYNISNGGRGNSGFKHSEEARAKIGLASKNRVFSPEARQNMSNARKGITLSEETKQKIRLANLGKIRPVEDRLKISEAQIGRKLTNEWRENIRKSRIGTKRSEETRKKMSNMRKGRPWSEQRKINWYARKSAQGQGE